MELDKLIENMVRERLAQALGLPTATAKPNFADVVALPYVIVRSRDAGVQCGHLLGYEGSTVRLAAARQMWSWKAKQGGTLLDCATFGADKSGSKFSSANNHVVVFNACAIIDVTETARKTYEDVTWS